MGRNFESHLSIIHFNIYFILFLFPLLFQISIVYYFIFFPIINTFPLNYSHYKMKPSDLSKFLLFLFPVFDHLYKTLKMVLLHFLHSNGSYCCLTFRHDWGKEQVHCSRNRHFSKSWEIDCSTKQRSSYRIRGFGKGTCQFV